MYRRSWFAIHKIKNSLKYSSSYSATQITKSAHSFRNQYFQGKINAKPLFTTAFGLTLFSWPEIDKKTNAEDEMIVNLKWSILLIQRKEYAKAEQLLHITLRMAQQTQNQNAITYTYDVMANLALGLGQYDKAEKLFVEIMQRLIATGLKQDDIKNIHISLKLARIYHMKGDKERATLGYKWSLENLHKNIGYDTESENNVLIALANDWYARILVDEKKYEDALKHMKISYEILTHFEKGHEEQIVILLSDIGTMCEKLDDLTSSETYLKEAIRRGHLLKELPELSPIYVNLGRIYLRQRLFEKARKCCGYGWKLGIDRNNQEYRDEASLCLEEINKMNRK